MSLWWGGDWYTLASVSSDDDNLSHKKKEKCQKRKRERERERERGLWGSNIRLWGGTMTMC